MARLAVVTITQRCNQRCAFCFEDGNRPTSPELTTSQVMATITDLRERGADDIIFMGAETLLRPDVLDVVSGARDIGFDHVSIATNGTGFARPGLLRRLMDRGLASIELSVHAHDAETNAKITGMPKSWDRLVSAMKEIGASSISTTVNVVMWKDNIHNLADVARVVRSYLQRNHVTFKYKFPILAGAAVRAADNGQFIKLGDVDAERVCEQLDSDGMEYLFHGLPLCRLGSHCQHSLEAVNLVSDALYFDFDTATGEYLDSQHQLTGRCWPKSPCAQCSIRSLCGGILETYRRRFGVSDLSASTLDPIPLVERISRQEKLEGTDAQACLRRLEQLPRPSQFLGPSEQELVHYRHPSHPEPLRVALSNKQEGLAGYWQTDRFSLSWRRWKQGDPLALPEVVALLELGRRLIDVADRRGATLAQARTLLKGIRFQGWQYDDS